MEGQQGRERKYESGFYCESFVVLAAVSFEDCVETLYYFCAFECSFFTDCPSLEHR